MSAMSDLYTRALLQLEAERADWETLPLNEQNALVAGRAQEIADALDRAMLAALTPKQPDRRRLDRAFPAVVAHKDGSYEVRAGDSRVDARDPYEAYVIAFAHNELLAHPEDAWRMRGAVA